MLFFFYYDAAFGTILQSVIEAIALYAGIFGLAGNITAGTTLPRRAAAVVTLVLILVFLLYVFQYVVPQYGISMDLAYFSGVVIVLTFPQACVSFVLWRKGWLPKMMAVVACACGAYLIFTNWTQYSFYISYYKFGWGLDFVTFTLDGMVSTGVMYAFYFLWCSLWVDLNVRPARYLAKHTLAIIPPSTRLRHLGYVLIVVAVVWALGWWRLSLTPLMNIASYMVSIGKWSDQRARMYVLEYSGAGLIVPLIVILIILATYLLVRARRLDKAAKEIEEEFVEVFPVVHSPVAARNCPRCGEILLDTMTTCPSCRWTVEVRPATK